MKIKEIVSALERFAPLPLQDGFDNAGLQIGLTDAEATGALLCLDVTEAVLDEAIALGYNLVISHHPLIFKGYKSITGKDYVERCILKAIKNDIVLPKGTPALRNPTVIGMVEQAQNGVSAPNQAAITLPKMPRPESHFLIFSCGMYIRMISTAALISMNRATSSNVMNTKYSNVTIKEFMLNVFYELKTVEKS